MTTHAERLQQLERLKHYGTRYEVTLTNGRTTYLLGYTSRRSRQGLLDVLRLRGSDVVEKTSMPENAIISFVHWNTIGFDLGFDSWHVRFTGRTQREAIVSGEHDYIGHMTP